MNFLVLLQRKDLRWVVMALLIATLACSSNFQSGEVQTQRASTAQTRKGCGAGRGHQLGSARWMDSGPGAPHACRNLPSPRRRRRP